MLRFQCVALIYRAFTSHLIMIEWFVFVGSSLDSESDDFSAKDLKISV